MLTKNDWSNTGYRFYKSLQLCGFDIKFLKGAKHGFNYPEQGEIHPAISKAKGRWNLNVPELREMAESAKAIHFIASQFIDTGVNLKKKFVVVQHGGSMYRQSHGKVNALFNSFANKTIIQCPDLLGFGANDETLIYYPVDTDFLQPDFEQKNKFVTIGHFPRNPAVKGTAKILEGIDIAKKTKIGKRFKYIGVTSLAKQYIKWEQHLNRVRECDIIIETCAPTLKGQKYGEWANTALEAAALGKVVISNTLSLDIYNREYGELGIHVANNSKVVAKKIEHIVSMSSEELVEEKKRTRDWVVKNHSLQANAKRLMEKVYNENSFHR